MDIEYAKTKPKRRVSLKEKKTEKAPESYVPKQQVEKTQEPKLTSFFMDLESCEKINTGTQKLMLVVKNGKHEIGIAVDAASNTIEFASFNGKTTLRNRFNLQQLEGFIIHSPTGE